MVDPSRRADWRLAAAPVVSGQCLPAHPVKHTSPEILEYDEEGNAHFIGIADRRAAQLPPGQAFEVFDNDSGMTMLRIGSMNLMLHASVAAVFYKDTLSKDFTEERTMM